MKKMIQRHQLSLEEKAEAARLKGEWENYKGKNPGVSQEWLGRQAGVGGQSAVSQYMRGELALNFANLVKFSSVLGVNPADISPRLVREHLGDKALPGEPAETGLANSANRSHNRLMSGEAKKLVEWVERIDGLGGPARNMFSHLSSFLELAESLGKKHNPSATHTFISEAEDLKDIARPPERPGVSHANRAHRTKK